MFEFSDSWFRSPSDLSGLFYMDIVLVGLAVYALSKLRIFSFAHPAFLYLLYHVYSVSFRLWRIIDGDPVLWELNLAGSRMVVCYHEIARAVFWSDVGLVMFVGGAFLADLRFRKKYPWNFRRKIGSVVSAVLVYRVAVFSILVGSVAFFLARLQSNVEGGGWLFLMSMWPMIGLLLLIHAKGFRAKFVVPLAAYLVFVGLQGYHRTMLVMPLLNLSVIGMLRRSQRWPTFSFVVLIGFVGLLFPVLKGVGRAFQDGDMAQVEELIFSGDGPGRSVASQYSEDFLDQFACCLSLTDQYDEVYYGRYYSAVTVYWIPRSFWPDKPVITQPLLDIATESRPIDDEGRVATYLGDAYLNFRELGLFFYPVIIAYFLSYWYEIVLRSPQFSMGKIFYVTAYASFIQLYRDGLASFPMFALAWNIPVVILYGLHVFGGRVKKIC